MEVSINSGRSEASEASIYDAVDRLEKLVAHQAEAIQLRDKLIEHQEQVIVIRDQIIEKVPVTFIYSKYREAVKGTV